MGKIVLDQVLAGSGPDRHGVGIDRSTIRQLFQQIHSHSVGGSGHDLCQAPGVRTFNHRLDEQPNGELVIKADIEILNEEAFSRMGGFSISFLRMTHRFGPEDDPAIKILLNPRHFDFESSSRYIARIVPTDLTFDVTERIEKAEFLEIATIVVVLSGVSEVVKGFLSAAGGDLYQWLRGLRRTDDPQGKTALQVEACQHVSGEPVRFLLEVPPEVTKADFAQIDLQRVGDKLPPGIETPSIARIVGTVAPGPSVILRFAVLKDGSCFHFDSE